MKESMSALLELLQIDQNMPVAELNVGQLVEILNFSSFPPTCADFAGIAVGQQYPNHHMLMVNGVRFHLYYNGGGRISEWGAYPGEHFLEMVGDVGSVIIDSPFKATLIDLEVMQAGPDPVEIRYYNNAGHLLGTVTTTQKDVVEHIRITGTNLTIVSMHNPELLIRKVCFQA